MGDLEHVPPTIKTGDEVLTFREQKLPFKLLDFWRWSVSDILSNATRGRLAEFIVATATNIDVNTVRDEWGAYDLFTPDEIKLEIKSAAYLQSWHQELLSIISFSTKLTRHWDSLTNKFSDTPKRQADVYVFCHLSHKDKKTVNPLNLDHWEFYVLATCALNEYKRSQHSITLKSLKGLTSPIGYDMLYDKIKEENKRNLRPPTNSLIPQ